MSRINMLIQSLCGRCGGKFWSFSSDPLRGCVASNGKGCRLHVCDLRWYQDEAREKRNCCALLKTCCRIGGRNHHSRHRAMIVATLACKDLLSCFWRLASWQGKCTRHGFTLRSTCIRRKLLSNSKSGPKNGVNFRTYNLFPSLLKAGFGGRWLVCETQLLFLLLPYLGLNIWSAWPQLQRLSVDQTGFITKTSTCYRYPCAIIIICAQYSYYGYKHTHTVRAHSHEARNDCFWDPKNRLADSSFAHSKSYAINTAPTTADIHTYRQGPWVQGMVSCKKKFPSLDLLRSMSAQHRETYKATSSWHREFKLRFLALVWHGSLQWCSVRE